MGTVPHPCSAEGGAEAQGRCSGTDPSDVEPGPVLSPKPLVSRELYVPALRPAQAVPGPSCREPRRGSRGTSCTRWLQGQLGVCGPLFPGTRRGLGMRGALSLRALSPASKLHSQRNEYGTSPPPPPPI